MSSLYSQPERAIQPMISFGLLCLSTYKPLGKVSFFYNSRRKGPLFFRHICLPNMSRIVSEFCDLRPTQVPFLHPHLSLLIITPLPPDNSPNPHSQIYSDQIKKARVPCFKDPDAQTTDTLELLCLHSPGER